MANAPELTLEYGKKGCPDCGQRVVKGFPPLPDVGDDFNWLGRDFDAIRQLMLEDLAARYPEKTRFTPADLEVVITEVMAAVLDQISDMADRVAVEAFLETARHPASVRRLLSFIGVDPVNDAIVAQDLVKGELENKSEKERNEALEAFWLKNPLTMKRAREAGPRQVQVNHRMVTKTDYQERLEDHPLVLLAHASTFWNGSWPQIEVALIFIRPEMSLDALLPKAIESSDLFGSYEAANSFALDEEFEAPEISLTAEIQNALTPRMLIRPYLDAYRMVGQDVRLRDAIPVGIVIIVSLVVHANYHASEVKREAEELMTSAPGGLFAPGSFAFGEDLFANDFISALTAIPGVAQVCLVRFKRVGGQYPDRADSGRIALHGLEVAMCENDLSNPEFGYSQVWAKGGRSV